MGYYSNVNEELLELVPLTARLVLEVGCGAGRLGRAWRARNPLARYLGVDVAPAAREAGGALTRLILGDIEQPRTLEAVDRARGDAPCDAVVCGDVLEHLRDPWRVLAALAARTREGGVCLASLPNVGHYSVLEQLLRGRFDYADIGLLDRTHLRFFTLDTATDLFAQAGWTVCDAAPRDPWPDKTAAALALFSPLAARLGLDPARFRRDLTAYQWTLRAVKGPVPEPLRLAGLLPPGEGAARERLADLLRALASLPEVAAVWAEARLDIPGSWREGVFLVPQVLLDRPDIRAGLETLAARGWVLLALADPADDPDTRQALAAVHAVWVPDQAQAEALAPWHDTVAVFPDALLALPDIPPDTPKRPGPPRLLQAATAGAPDGAARREALLAVAGELTGRANFVVVGDRDFHDRLPAGLAGEFLAAPSRSALLAALADCDVALLPDPARAVADGGLERWLRDACAAGAVLVFTPGKTGLGPGWERIGRAVAGPAALAEAVRALCLDPAALARHRAAGLAWVVRTGLLCRRLGERLAALRRLLAERPALEARRRRRLGRD